MNTVTFGKFPAIRPRKKNMDSSRRICRVSIVQRSWPALWNEVSMTLQRSGYQVSTLLLYRQIIRKFAEYVNKPPNQVSAQDVKNYLLSLTEKTFTWHWTGMNISILRTIFDKLGGLNALNSQRGPKRKRPIPEFFSREEIARLLSATINHRDMLVIALLYGCGLKVGELQRIRWRDIQVDEGTLCLPSRYDQRIRHLKLPVAIIPILRAGREQCQPENLVFSGASEGNPLSSRLIEIIVRNCARQVGCRINVTPQILRNSFIVHSLEAGVNVRQLQEALDHRWVETTLRYHSCIYESMDQDDAKPALAVKINRTSYKLLGPSPFPMNQPDIYYWSNMKARWSKMLRGYLNSA